MGLSHPEKVLQAWKSGHCQVPAAPSPHCYTIEVLESLSTQENPPKLDAQEEPGLALGELLNCWTPFLGSP